MKGWIDVHHHILPASYVEQVGPVKIGAQGSSGKCPYWSEEDALERMDAAGIATAITSISAPGLDVAAPEQERQLARECNEIAARLGKRHPGRFGYFAALPWLTPGAAEAEALHAFESLQADGVCLLSNHRGRYLGDAMYLPLYEWLNQREGVVFVHPTSPEVPVDIAGLSASMLDFTFDTARAIVSLVFQGVLQRYPHVRFIFSHMGGALPYIAQRIEVLARNNPALQAYIPDGIGVELSKCYFDTALSANRTTLAAMRELTSVDRMLFGTDYPFGPKDQMQSASESLEALPLLETERHAVGRGTAEALFPRFRSS